MSAKGFASTTDITEKKITFSEIGPDIYAFTAEGDPNTAVIVGDDSCIVFDAQATPAMANSVIERVRTLHKQGAQLYLWSSGGADYARSSAEELGLSECFAAFLPKPTLILDDQEVADWRYCNYEHPAAC